MGRRTGWWRTEARRAAGWHGVLRRGRALAAAAGAALCITVALPQAATAAGTPTPYAFAEDARTVKGATGTTDAVRLEPGGTYRSAVRDGGKLYYRLELDATADAYVSVTAVPGTAATVTSSDGLKVSVQDADSHTCSTGAAHFGPTQSPHPIAAWASREVGPDTYLCKQAGTYYVVVERRTTPGSSPGDWDLELDYVSEPALRKATDSGSTSAPETWNSASPQAVVGDATRRAGGAGFASAGALGQGVWKDAVRPGQTLFYKVPVDWGQQLYATAETGSSAGGDGFVGTALTMSLYNPVRGYVDDVGSGYSGDQTSATLDPLPPVAYDNRHAVQNRVSGMRFAGWYYLAVHLGAPVADKFGNGPFGLTLRVRVSGTADSGPSYAGPAEPSGVFEVTRQDREEAAAGAGSSPGNVPGGTTGSASGGATGGGTGAAETGADGARTGDHGTMTLVAVGGIGTGSLLVLALVVWTAVARRRAVSEGAAMGAAPVVRGEYGPPRAW
ncbi:hypothetical protein ABZS96_01185 [Streptomyces avermitilis]|uniref:hypothetical protein n=2 Tax=Streptomyces avermitilis TaxID=33903 RepID=UPI0033A86B45